MVLRKWVKKNIFVGFKFKNSLKIRLRRAGRKSGGKRK